MSKLLKTLASLSNSLDSIGCFKYADSIDALLTKTAKADKSKEKFWAKVDKSKKHNGCWIWAGAKDSGGYGIVTIDGKNYAAHRLSYKWYYKRRVPKGFVLQHVCDKPSCVKPAHLIPGTQQDNADDRVRKNRSAINENNGRARLTKKDIRKIKKLRAKGLTQTAIAKLFNVGRSTISSVLSLRTWKNLVD